VCSLRKLNSRQYVCFERVSGGTICAGDKMAVKIHSNLNRMMPHCSFT
jgi:hypothetical protein